MPGQPAVFSEDEITEALGRVCASEHFARAPQLRRLLEYLVRCSLAKKTDIRAYTIGVEALGRRDDFDPDQDSIVRVQAARLRRALESYYAAQGAHDPVQIRLPAGGYVLSFEHGPPLAAAHGPQSALPVPGPGRLRARGLMRACIAAGLIAAVAVLTQTVRNWTASEALLFGDRAPEALRGNGLPTIVVQQFRASGIPVQSQGMRRAIAGNFARFEFVNTVLAPRMPPGESKPVRPSAAENNGNSVYDLSTTVSHEGDRAQLRFQLADRADGSIIWTRLIDVGAELASPAAQKHVARILATDLAQPFGVVFVRERAIRLKQNSGDPRYLCILRAQDSLLLLNDTALAGARGCLEATARRDPDYSLAHSYLSVIYNRSFLYALDSAGAGQLIDKAMRAANLAVQTNPASARAYLALFISLYNMHDFEAASAAIAKARELNDDDDVIVAEYAGGLIRLGRVDEGMALLERADLALASSCSTSFYAFLGSYLQGRLEKAARHAGRITCPQYPNSYIARALVANAAGKPDAAKLAVDSLRALLPLWRNDPGAAVNRLFPDPKIAERIMRDLETAGLARMAAH